ncbi:MAG TPA: RNase H-like domain-containing protein, partial [Candidatus Obscuribacterales bacterium]
MLAFPDPSKPYTVTVDASDIGLGAVLEQDGRPVAFESRKLIPAERNYHATDRELLAVVHALRVWRCYLEGGQQFEVKTDHNPNTHFQDKPMLSRREARWSEFLQQFDFKWKYKPGKENVVADSLSRMPLGLLVVRIPRPVLAAITTRAAVAKASAAAKAEEARRESPVGSEEVFAEYHGQDVMPVVDVQPPVRTLIKAPKQPREPLKPAKVGGRSTSVLDKIKSEYSEDSLFTDSDATSALGLRFRDGLWWRNSQVAVPSSEAIKDAILFEMHDCPVAGHVGITKTQKAVSQLFWWPTLAKDVEHWVQTCDVCQHNKGDRRNRGLLQPVQIPQRAWDSVGMDLITQLPETSDKHDAIIVFVDRLTKMVHFVPTVTSCTAE